jgi:small conductance mechanosensitive channel
MFNINSLNLINLKIEGAVMLATSFRIGLIIVLSLLFVKFCELFTRRFRKLLEKSPLYSEERLKLRTKTIVNIINSFIILGVSIFAFLLIIKELKIDIGPIIAGAGVLGLALSFSTQNLVKDIINGFFILLEDQYGIGDIIKVGESSGIVENMSLRTTILRDLSGNVHIIPNGEIKQVTVMTKGWSRAVIDIKTFYKQDIQKIFGIIAEEAAALRAELTDKILEEPEVLGINSIEPNGITIRVIIKTKPAMQWDVERALRKRIIERFNQLGIELPFFESISANQF